jgi:hypothetical protein
VWFEDLLELSNNSDAPILSRVRVMYFYSRGYHADLRNHESKTLEKRGLSVFKNKTPFKKNGHVSVLR